MGSIPEQLRLFSPTSIVSVLAIALLLTLPRFVNEDSRLRFEALNQLFGSGLTPTTKYPLIGPLFAAPLWGIGHATGDPERVVALFNRLLALAGAAAMWWAVRPVLSAEVARRFLLILAFASMLPYHLFYFGGEVFTAVLLGVGSAMVVVRQSLWGLLLMAIGAANTPATIPGMALGLAVLFWHDRRLRLGLPIFLAAGLVLAENAIRRGDPFAVGYEGEHGSQTPLPYSARPGFSYPLLFGLLSVLFSFGKGLVFFTPGLFVPLGNVPQASASALDSEHGISRLRVLYRVWIGIVVGLVLVYACWWSWYGGYFWGPRFFLFACLPASLALANRTSPSVQNSPGANLLLLVVLLLSCWVGANGVVYQTYGDEAFLAEGYRLEFALWYVPECSPLWWPFVQPKVLSPADMVRLGMFAIGAMYLVAPLLVTVGCQLREVLPRAWARLRSGPRIRF